MVEERDSIGEHVARNTARIDSLEKMLDERDIRYEQSFISLKERMVLSNERDRVALDAAKESVKNAMDASEKAIHKAEMAAEKRFENVNEFRAQMGDMQQTFARSDLVEARVGALDEKINEIFRRLEITKGRGSAFSDVWIWVLAALAAGAAMAKLFLGGV